MLCCIHYNIPVYIRAALEEQYAKTEAIRQDAPKESALRAEQEEYKTH